MSSSNSSPSRSPPSSSSSAYMEVSTSTAALISNNAMLYMTPSRTNCYAVKSSAPPPPPEAVGGGGGGYPTTVILQPRSSNSPPTGQSSGSPGHLSSAQDYLSSMSDPRYTGQCGIVLLEEPEEKFRFRYKSEMQGTHGCIHGSNSKKKAKSFPTIQVVNVPEHVKTVRYRVGLYTNEVPRRHHVHKVMWKHFSDVEENFVEGDANIEQNFRQVWQGLGIIHTSKKYIQDTIYNRLRKKFLEEKAHLQNNPCSVLTDAEDLSLISDAAKQAKEIGNKMNTVVLGFEAFYVDPSGIYRPLCPMIYSNAINNLKNPSTGDLKITRVSRISASVLGGTEVFIFIERVKKDDIRVRFFEENEDDERVWQAFADFTENDVHHQYAIAFKTPAYRDKEVTEEVNVYFELYRRSDEAISDRRAFTFKPAEEARLGKRRRQELLLQPSTSAALPEEPRFSLEQLKEEDEVEAGGRHLLLTTAPAAAVAASSRQEDQAGITMNFVEALLRDPEYCSTLMEPSPFDYMTDSSLPGKILPDLVGRRHHLVPRGRLVL